jgi:predicted nucleic acid-binding protein
MVKKLIRVYADTSVFGGVFDEEFEKSSNVFFDEVKQGKFQLVVSRLVEEELSAAPQKIQDFFTTHLSLIEMNAVTEEAILLQEAYLFHHVVGEGSMADALHVASATILGCQIIVSWNFKHIVHFQKIPLYNGINRMKGYGELGIYTPMEMIADENEDL